MGCPGGKYVLICPLGICVRQNVVFQSTGVYDVQRVLIADARLFLALAAILDWLTHLASISYGYRSDAKQDEFGLSQAALL